MSRIGRTLDDGDSATEKMFRMLDILARSPVALDADGVCDVMDVTKPSVVRMMRQMEDDGIIKRRLGSKGYVPAQRLADLALQSLLKWASTADVRDLLKGVVGATGETCNLGILFDGEIVYLERVECERPVRVQLTAGSTVPVHCTAIGKILLAHMPAADRQHFLKSASLSASSCLTVTRWSDLEARMADILEAGFAVDRGEYVDGLGGIAVPVMDVDGRVFAGLAVHAPLDRLRDGDIETHVPFLQGAAERLSACLPHR